MSRRACVGTSSLPLSLSSGLDLPFVYYQRAGLASRSLQSISTTISRTFTRCAAMASGALQPAHRRGLRCAGCLWYAGRARCLGRARALGRRHCIHLCTSLRAAAVRGISSHDRGLRRRSRDGSAVVDTGTLTPGRTELRPMVGDAASLASRALGAPSGGAEVAWRWSFSLGMGCSLVSLLVRVLPCWSVSEAHSSHVLRAGECRLALPLYWGRAGGIH